MNLHITTPIILYLIILALVYIVMGFTIRPLLGIRVRIAIGIGTAVLGGVFVLDSQPLFWLSAAMCIGWLVQRAFDELEREFSELEKRTVKERALSELKSLINNMRIDDSDSNSLGE